MQSIPENIIVTTVANLLYGNLEREKKIVLTVANTKKKKRIWIGFFMKSKRDALISCMNGPQKKS